mgnify:CR=1 FL=1
MTMKNLTAKNLTAKKLAAAKLTTLGCLMLLLAGCGLGTVPPAPVLLDLGSPGIQPTATAVSRTPVALPMVTAVGTLQSKQVIWRIGSSGQPSAYATVRWLSPPAVMVRERLFDRLSLDGPTLTEQIGADMPQIRVSLLAFEQIFSADGSQNEGVVTLQAVLVIDTQVVDQTRLTYRVPAREPTAESGAQALRRATDQAADAVAKWVNTSLNPS